jgi:glycosyltransferase involved in cell wall biosynthesis
MNILGIISFKAFPAKMGGQKGVADFYHYLSGEANVLLACPKENEAAEGYPFRILPFLFNQWVGFLNIWYLPFLIRLIRKQRIDVIIIEQSYYGWLGLLLKYLTGKPFVIHSHNIEGERFRIAGKKWWKLYSQYEKWAHQKADHLFYKCEEDARYFIALTGKKHPPYSIIPYGTHFTHIPDLSAKSTARAFLEKAYSLTGDERLFFFNGTMDYAPNADAVRIISEALIPQIRKENFVCKIILSGNHISEELKSRLLTYPEIILAGYVPDINLYMQGCDAFIQPSSLATGIKTKLVEALANNLTVITMESGARGLRQPYLSSKMILVKDNAIHSFLLAMQEVKGTISINTPAAFFTDFYWQNITHTAYLSLQQL